MAADPKVVRTKPNTAAQRLIAQAAKAVARAELAKDEVRAAKIHLKKVRKSAKAAKKAAKHAKKRAEAAAVRARTAADAQATAATKPAGTKTAGKTQTPKPAKTAILPRASADRPRAATPQRSPKPRQSAAEVARSIINRPASTKRINGDAAASGEAMKSGAAPTAESPAETAASEPPAAGIAHPR